MEFTILPDDRYPAPVDAPVTIAAYASDYPTVKGKSMLKKNMISLVISGEKIIHYAEKAIDVDASSLLLLSAGNYLTTERFADKGKFQSILIFFDGQVLENFLTERKDYITTRQTAAHVLFKRDPYIENFIAGLQNLLQANTPIPADLQLIKMKELLMYLLLHQPEQLYAFRNNPASHQDNFEMMKVMQANITSQLTVSDLAFLCNMSLSTFKRKFTAIYKTSPSKWFTQKKMEMAADLLIRKKAKPSELYLQLGYENHSSFSQAFRNFHGASPRDFQKLMNV